MLNRLLVITLLAAAPLSAEPSSKARLLAEINRQIWLPFVEGVRSDEAQLYVGVHSPDFHWVAPGSKGRIMDLREYDDDSRMVMKKRKDAGERSDIEVRFLERNVTGTFAVEKVVTKFVLHSPGKPPRVSYSIKHVFSRKENGVWKMWLQYGSTEKATEETFLSAAPPEDLDRF